MSSNEVHLQFVTGRLAESAVQAIVEKVAERHGFQYTISVLPITVAALMTPRWLLRKLVIAEAATQIVLPGHLEPGLAEIQEHIGCQVVCGPRDIRDLPVFFGQKSEKPDDYGTYQIEILAEINHANRMTTDAISSTADRLAKSGADVIDLGCTPGEKWASVAEAVHRLREEGRRVSIDSFDMLEVAQAVRAGAELVLSVNSSNREAAPDWGCEVVVIPDDPTDEKSFEETVDFLGQRDIAMRLDPILEPIGCGFARSLQRYARWRDAYPDVPMMMGIGNITELTDVDSAGVNLLLLAICEELQIGSVLTTQVINWARSSVKECALARQLVHYACRHRTPPKNLDPRLILLRDARVNEYDVETIEQLAGSIRDQNVRLFTQGGEIHAISAAVHARSSDPFEVMEQLLASEMGATIDASHAFYLGFEMAKALTANTLGKRYEQDEALDWGFLTRPEQHHRLRRKRP